VTTGRFAPRDLIKRYRRRRRQYLHYVCKPACLANGYLNRSTIARIATFHFGRSPTGLVQARFNLRHTKRYAMASSHPLHFAIATMLVSRATQKWRLIC
jgi:hypothetical protein